MATGGVNDDDTNSIVIQDSDEIEEIGCEQCEKYGRKYSGASGLCVNCTEYMCSICIEYHKQYMPGHNIQNKSTMPQDVCNEKCPDHSDQMIKFYCSSCDDIACITCKTNKHNTCINVAHLPALVKDIENSIELVELEEDIEEMSKDIDDTGELLDANTRFINNVECTAKSVVDNYKVELIAAYKKLQHDNIEEFDRKMKEIIEKLKKERQEKVELTAKKERQFKQKIDKSGFQIKRLVDIKKVSVMDSIQTTSQENKLLTDQVHNIKSDIEQKKKTLQRCKLFTSIRSAKKQADDLKHKLYQMKIKTEIQPLQVETKKIERTSEKLESSVSFFSLKEIHISYRKKVAAFLYNMNLPFEVKSMCLLSDTQLLMADEKRESVLNFNDLKRNKDVHEVIKISSKPAVVAKIDETEAVVTLPNLGIITVLVFDSTNKLVKRTSEIKVSRSCHGIACCQQKLVVSFLIPPRIEVINKQGDVLSTIESDSEKTPLFSTPRYLVISPENTKLYVADTYRNSITCMSFDGKVESVYKEKTQDVTQLAVDMSGSIYVWGQKSKTINQLSTDLNHVKMLLDGSSGMKNPGSICCYGNMLLASEKMPNWINVKVFKLAYE